MQITVIIAESTTGNTPCNSTQSRDKADHGDGCQTSTRDSGMGRRKSQPPKGKTCSVFFFQMSNSNCANLMFFFFYFVATVKRGLAATSIIYNTVN